VDGRAVTLTLTPQPDPPAAEQLREALPKLAELSELARVEEDGCGFFGRWWEPIE
jgi:hypothetical protein